MLPCLIFEDEHLLVVNKPAGLNTHAPNPFAGEGLYDWLRHREPRWASLAIIHRLDKETSGLLVLAKTPLANRSLTDQFTQHQVRKRYVFLTDRTVAPAEFTEESALVRLGEKYVSRPLPAAGERAVTHFRVLGEEARETLVEAQPQTGRTHQIRVQAAARGIPVLGDTRYGGSAAKRVFLHATELVFQHPETGIEMRFHAPADFTQDSRLALRLALIDPQLTDAYRVAHGAADGWPGWYVDRLGDYLLSQSEGFGEKPRDAVLGKWVERDSLRGAYHKPLDQHLGRAGIVHHCPYWVQGSLAPEEVMVRENGLRFALRFDEGCSVGLFLDQRDNRRRFLANHVGADFPVCAEGLAGREILNTFAYTCGFSVCAAQAGARTTNVDLSKNYLDRGRRNFSLNGLDHASHAFLFGDVYDWMRRLAKKKQRFDAIILDPPTFSSSKRSGAFKAEKDYGYLVESALPLLKADGVLFASTNAARFSPEKFLESIAGAIQSAGRVIRQQHYVPQPPDFPIHRDEPAYLKTVWMRIK